MSDIWNNPLMWQAKKAESNDDSAGVDAFEFNFDDEFDFEDEFDFSSTFDEYQDFQKQASLVDSAAKAGEYKEASPQMAGGNAAASFDKELSNLTQEDETQTNPTYILNIVWGDKATQEVPPLNTLIGISNKPLLNDDDNENFIILDKLGITTDKIFDKGMSIGLSATDIANNLDIIGSAIALRELTSGSLDSNELTDLYRASMNGDIAGGQTILDNNSVTLGDSASINDIMALSQLGNNKIFKSGYLN